MSRIGKHAVTVPAGVDVTIDGQTMKAKGPKGQLSLTLVDDMAAKLDRGKIRLTPRQESRRARAMWGMQRTLVSNLVNGVANGYSASLEIRGVGFRASLQDKKLVLQLGYSHDVVYPVPPGIDIKVEKQTAIKVSGADRQYVGQVAAEIRAFRPPEPYKGKGVKYAGEKVRHKEGKKK